MMNKKIKNFLIKIKSSFIKIKKIFIKIKNSDFFQTYKEEMIAIPLLLIGFYMFNGLMIKMFPQGAFFDFYSQIETIVSKIVLFIITLWSAHLALRISFPKIYKYLHDKVYHNFDSISEDKKIEYTIKFILVFILAAALVFGAGAQTTNKKIDVREKLIDTINVQLNVRETSENRGPMVDKYLKTVNSKLGQPWCGGFVGANLTWLGVKNPNTAWSPSYANSKDIIWSAKRKTNNTKLLPGDVITYYYPSIGRVGHVGFLEKVDKSGFYIAIEGNTNTGFNREVDGVYKLKRDPKKVHAISRYIKITPIETTKNNL